ncbi:unnamed protein product [Urochloa humidicola]
MAESVKVEQARKALALAEKSFLAGNVPAARQWMLSAARLAPGLPGVAQAAAAYDVHAAAAARRPVDWYAVLGLPQQRPRSSAGDVLAHDDIKRQHRRLCLLVHPDKNPSAAADGAFKLVQAAWEALSARHPPPPRRRSPCVVRRRDRPTRRHNRGQRWPSTPPPRGAGAHQGRRRPSYADAARAAARSPAAPPSPPRAEPRVPPPPPASRCPSCGALTPYGKRSLRCMACHWRPKGRWWRAGSEFFK